jgi:hypothetical protein
MMHLLCAALFMAIIFMPIKAQISKFLKLADPFAHPSDRTSNAVQGIFTLEGIIITGKKRVATVLCEGERYSLERGDVIKGHTVKSIGMHYIQMERGNEKKRLTLE